jgi:hypothetical protein
MIFLPLLRSAQVGVGVALAVVVVLFLARCQQRSIATVNMAKALNSTSAAVVWLAVTAAVVWLVVTVAVL